MDDLDRAILTLEASSALFLQQTSAAAFDAAMKYIDQLKSDPHAWKFCAVKIFNTDKDQVSFFCLQVLKEVIEKRHSQLTLQERIDLRGCLISYLQQYLCNPQKKCSFYMRNKYAQVLVLLFKAEFPEHWPTFFDDLLALVNDPINYTTAGLSSAAGGGGGGGGAGGGVGLLVIDVYLRVMAAIDQEIASRDIHRTKYEADRCTVIKDCMREKHLAKIVQSWYNILLACQTVSVDLAQLALENIKNYVAWIDIKLIVNEPMLALFFQLLLSDKLREHVMECLYELLSKGMGPNEKLALVSTLRLKELIQSIQLSNEESIIDFLIKVSRLVNLMALEALSALQDEKVLDKNLAQSVLDNALEMIFKFMNHKDDEVSQATMEFVTVYIQYLKKLQKISAGTAGVGVGAGTGTAAGASAGASAGAGAGAGTGTASGAGQAQAQAQAQGSEGPGTGPGPGSGSGSGSGSGGELSEKHLSHLKTLLQIIGNKMEYDDDFNFEKMDEYEEDFIQFRRELGNLFKSITQLHPTLVGAFVEHLIRAILSLPDPMATLGRPTAYKIEVALTLFWKMGEGLSESIMQQNKAFFITTIHALIEKNLIAHPHRMISGVIFDCVNRYSKFLGGNIGALQSIVTAVLDKRGARHPHPAVCAKCCDVFMRLCRSLRNEMVTLLPSIIPSVRDLVLFHETSDLHLDVRLNIFEGLGVLVCSLPPQTSETYMHNLLNPLIDQMQLIVSQELYKQDTPEFPRYTNWICELIEATATFSKGFPITIDKINPAISSYYPRALEIVLRTLQSIPNSPTLRDKSMLFMHRMMQCLGPTVISYLPPIISVFMINCEVVDMVQFLILLNQLFSNYKERVADVADQLLSPLLNKIFHVLNTIQVTPSSEEEREVNELKKHYYLFLSVIIQHNLSHILVSPANIGKFYEIFQTIIDGCKYWRDPNVQKVCFGMIKRLLANASSSPLFQQIFTGNNAIGIQNIATLSFEVCLDTVRFKIANAQYYLLLVEICSLLVDIYKSTGNAFVEFLKVKLPSLNCPPEFVIGFISILLGPKTTPKELSHFLKKYLQNATAVPT